MSVSLFFILPSQNHTPAAAASAARFLSAAYQSPQNIFYVIGHAPLQQNRAAAGRRPKKPPVPQRPGCSYLFSYISAV